MSRIHSNTTRASRQRGQSMIEYTVICAVLAAFLFAAASPAGRQMADAVRAFYANLTFFLSLP